MSMASDLFEAVEKFRKVVGYHNQPFTSGAIDGAFGRLSEEWLKVARRMERGEMDADDAQAVIRQQADEIAAYRTALENARAASIPKDTSYGAIAVALIQVGEIADKALAAYPRPTGVGTTSEQDGDDVSHD